MTAMLQESLCYRAMMALTGFLQEAYGESRTRHLVNRLAALFRGWMEGSLVLQVFWVEDSLSLWHGSKTYRVFAGVAARAKALFVQVALLLARARPGSVTFRLLTYYHRVLKASPLGVLIDISLVFLAANLLIRLVLQAYSTVSLLFFTAAFLLLFLLRFFREEIQAALVNSRVLQLSRWFFTLTEPGDKG